MRADKLTSKFQEALSDAQTIALGNDHAYIEPVHVLQAMLRQTDGPVALLQRAGVKVNQLNEAAEAQIKRQLRELDAAGHVGDQRWPPSPV